MVASIRWINVTTPFGVRGTLYQALQSDESYQTLGLAREEVLILEGPSLSLYPANYMGELYVQPASIVVAGWKVYEPFVRDTLYPVYQGKRHPGIKAILTNVAGLDLAVPAITLSRNRSDEIGAFAAQHSNIEKTIVERGIGTPYYLVETDTYENMCDRMYEDDRFAQASRRKIRMYAERCPEGIENYFRHPSQNKPCILPSGIDAHEQKELGLSFIRDVLAGAHR